MPNRSSGQELLRPWKTPIAAIRPIGNLNVHTCGIRSIEIALEDLTQHVMHIFLFEGVLGYRFEEAFGMERFGNTFLVEKSKWIREMSSKRQRTVDFSNAKHLKFNVYEGELDVVALQMPRYGKCPKASYIPSGISRDSLESIRTE